jgi:hypothetical protein
MVDRKSMFCCYKNLLIDVRTLVEYTFFERFLDWSVHRGIESELKCTKDQEGVNSEGSDESKED